MWNNLPRCIEEPDSCRLSSGFSWSLSGMCLIKSVELILINDRSMFYPPLFRRLHVIECRHSWRLFLPSRCTQLVCREKTPCEEDDIFSFYDVRYMPPNPWRRTECIGTLLSKPNKKGHYIILSRGTFV